VPGWSPSSPALGRSFGTRHEDRDSVVMHAINSVLVARHTPRHSCVDRWPVTRIWRVIYTASDHAWRNQQYNAPRRHDGCDSASLLLTGQDTVQPFGRMVTTGTTCINRRVLPEILTVPQLVKKFPAFYGTRRFITAFTSAHKMSVSWARWIQSPPPNPTTYVNVKNPLFRPTQCIYVFVFIVTVEAFFKLKQN
jgi:hypothetical protein